MAIRGHHCNVLADKDTVGTPLILFRVDVANAATGDIDVTVARKIRVVDAHLVKTGGAGGASDTIQVKNGANAISDAIDINVADQKIKRADTIDDANWEVAAAGTLRVTRTKASAANVACTVYVHAHNVS
jgi:hypothetical protein